MSALSADEFLQVFQTRRERCRKLLELSRRQRELIDVSDYTRLLTVLGQKQRILTQLDESSQALPNLWAEWHSHRDALPGSTRDDCNHVLAETETILAELVEEEGQSTDELVKRRDATRLELQSISEGSQVHDAYRDNLTPATHRHLNIDR